MTEGVRAAVAAGDIDERFLMSVRKVARQAARSKPTPTGSSSWSDEDIDDLAFDTVARVGTAKITLGANRAANDAEFEQWLRTAVRTTLHQRARGTPAGRVLRAIDDALAEDHAFTLSGGAWRLTDDCRQAAWDGDRARLSKAAWMVLTNTIRQDPYAEKIQIAWRDDMRAVCKAVLAESGPLAKAVLGEIVAERFNTSYESRSDYLDLGMLTGAKREDTPVLMGDPAPSTIDDEDAARWMLSQFTEEELIELKAIADGASLRGIGNRLGCGKHKASLIRDRIKAKLLRLGEEAADDDLQASARLLRIVRQADELRHSPMDDGPTDD